MSPTGKYVIIYWKKLNKDEVSVRTFEDEQDMVDFAESKKSIGYATIVGETTYVESDGKMRFEIRNYGAYPFFKNWYKYLGLFLISLIIFLILTWK